MSSLRVDTPATVLDMIWSIGAEMRDSVAVVSGEHSLTYAELLHCAAENAQRLRDIGVRPGEFVLCGLSAGVELAVAWLACMYAQAVIVPIDPDWPELRLHAIDEATSARALIIEEYAVRPRSTATILSLTLVRGTTLVTPLRGRPSDLMYGFFTSGSTGVPKCALNHHGGLINRFDHMTRTFGFGHTVYQNSSPLFDSSIWQLLWPLTSGGTAVIPASRQRWDLDEVVRVVLARSITMTDFVPTIFKVLVRAIEAGAVLPVQLQSLRYVLVGGEEIDGASVRSFMQMLPSTTVINTYGHTEASIGMVFHQVREADGIDIPLGHPIQNTFVRIVDERMRSVPQGEIGEIVVAGICVGAGYLNAPALTERAFIDNPFPDLPGGKIYRSGDLGYVDADGCLRFSGRQDDQLKIRGVRIEGGEIVKALVNCHPGATDAIALSVPNARGEHAFIAVYTGQRHRAIEELRKSMAQQLPTTHMPSAILYLDSLPINANGKTDRKRVAELVRNMLTHAEQSGERELSSILQQVMDCFAEFLVNVKVQPDTDFFSNGGDSLDAVDLALRLRERLGVSLQANTVFLHPTPKGLHAYIAMQGDQQCFVCPVIPDIAFCNPAVPSQSCGTILLTGGTGYVGVHILERLLLTTRAHIHVLVRGRTGTVAFDRLASALSTAFPGVRFDWTRVSIVEGDLTKPSLGISSSMLDILTQAVDDIVHCASEVNFHRSADQLFTSNVLGTIELIRLCNTGRGKRLHYVSSVAAGTAHSRSADTLATGYAITKYDAEQALLFAAERGLLARIYRLDDVLPSSVTGFYNKRALVDLFLASCLRHRFCPQQTGSIGLLPVDGVAAQLCKAAAHPEQFLKLPTIVVLKASRYVDVCLLLNDLAQTLDRPLRSISLAEYTAFLSCAEDRESKLLHSMLSVRDLSAPLFESSSDCVDAQFVPITVDAMMTDLRPFAAHLV